MKKLIITLLCLLPLVALANTITGHVVDITDGDTVVVLDAEHRQHRIRLAGIDAPEHNQDFGNRSTENIARLTYGKTVTVDWKKEHQGRLIGKVIMNGVDVSLEQVKAGMAWWFRKYANEQTPADRRLYEQAEQQAQARRLGLWADPNPMPPWEFRHMKVEPVSAEQCPCSGSALCTGPKGGRYCMTGTGSKKYK